MTKPAIALDGRYFSNPSTGINKYLKALLSLLVENGYDVTVVLFEMPPEPIRDLEKCKIAIVKRNRYKIDPLWEQLSLPLFLYRNKFKYYVVPGNKGLPLLYFGPTKLILTVLDLIPFHFFRIYFKKQPVIMLMYFPSIIISLLKADKILALSQSTSDDIRRRFKRSSTMFMLPLRYMEVLDHQNSRPKKIRTQFVYNGGTDPRKNVPLMIDAFAQFHRTHLDYKLILIGGGSKYYQELVDERNLRDCVLITGYVSDKRKMKIIAESKGVIYPSMMEGYGLPIVEALMAGVRIICGTGGAQREVAQKAGIYLDPITKETIVNAFNNVAQLPDNDDSFRSIAKQQLDKLSSPTWEKVILSPLGD